MNNYKFSSVIVGSGLAGLTSALQLANNNIKVALICEKILSVSASMYAQGGIAAVISKEDNIKLHVKDTLIASANLAEEKIVTNIIKNSSNAIKWLESQGVIFDKKDNDYDLHLEGGHSKHRVLHIKDYSGKGIQQQLIKKVLENKNITIFENLYAFKILKKNNKCIGIKCYSKPKNKIYNFYSQNTILATGGASGIYKNSTNAHKFTGSAMSLAYQAGCNLKNLEFTQFHPTCFFKKNGQPLLISEALRGAGAKLESENGDRFMENIHPRKDLAPRDIVARAIYETMQNTSSQVYLNATILDSQKLKEEFPFIYQNLYKNGIDATKQRIPISPAAHYSCGGIIVDENAKTKLQNLYAVGECTYSGLHGANRLASNSLLECVVYALFATKNIINNINNLNIDIPNIKEIQIVNSSINIEKLTKDIRDITWNYLGITRNLKNILIAKEKISTIELEIKQRITNQNTFNYELDILLKLIDLVKLTIDSTYNRKESIGGHFII